MTLQRAPAVPLSIARPWQPRVTCDGRGDGTARAGPRTVGLAGRHCPGRPRRSLQRASAFPLSTAQPWQPRMTCDGCGGDTAGAGTRTRTRRRGSTLSRADRPGLLAGRAPHSPPGHHPQRRGGDGPCHGGSATRRPLSPADPTGADRRWTLPRGPEMLSRAAELVCCPRRGGGVMAVDSYPVYTTALAISRSARQAPSSGTAHGVSQIQH
jgi:hypothetical protein